MGKQKNIQKQLRDSQTELSKQYSWENMESGILSKLEVLDNEIEPQSDSSNRLLYILAFCCVPLVAAGLYFLLKAESNTTQEHIVQLEDKHPTIDINTQGNETNKTIIIGQTPAQLENKSETKTQDNSFKVTTEKGIQSKEISLSKQTETKTLLNNSVLNHQGSSQNNNKEESNNGSNRLANSSNTFTPSKIGSKVSKQTQAKIEDSTFRPDFIRVDHLGNYSSSLLASAFTLSMDRLVLIQSALSPDTIDHNEKQTLKLIVGLGSNLYSHNFSGRDLATARNTAHSSILGQSASISLDIPLNDKWTLNTGVSIDRSVTRLDYIGVLDTTIIAEVTTHNHNNVSGLTSTLIGDQPVIGTFHSDVELYNSTVGISVPLSLLRTLNFSKYTLGLGVGVEYNYRYQKSGRYLTDPNGISTDYQLASHSSDDPYQSHLLNGLVSVNLDYRLGNGFGVGVGVTGSYGINNAISEANTSSNPVRLRSQVRLFKTL